MAVGVVASIAVACGYPRPTLTGDQSCTDQQTMCVGKQFETCVDGAFTATQQCPSACDDTLGCTSCTPGTGTCNGNVAHTCNAAGTDFEDVTCDPVQGMTCDATIGACAGVCAPAMVGKTNLGCEFYPTVTGNIVNSALDFAVTISNPGATEASVMIEGGGITTPIAIVVPPSGFMIQNLPWQYDLKLCGAGDPTTDGCVQRTAVHAVDGAFHLRSNAPIAVAQFNPVETVVGGVMAYSNDASLLLPTTAWGTEFYVASYTPMSPPAPTPPFAAEFAVVAAHPDSHVTISTTTNTIADIGVPSFIAHAPQVVAMTTGDAFELTSGTGDLTGTHVISDRPIQVISAHNCATVPTSIPACNHLEESTPPVSALGTDYVVVAPQNTSMTDGNPEVIRIIATAANTHLTYSPAQTGAPAMVANAGDFVELTSTASFEITADHKIVVAQYMEGGSSNTGMRGDPAMTFALPVAQYLMTYTFGMPATFSERYVDIVASIGTNLVVDTVAATVVPINATYGLKRLTMTAGAHAISGDHPFGLQVYGVDQYTAFWFPGGASTRALP